jgi:hypothetical protein
MKMVKSLLLGSAAGLVAVAGAQAADLPVKAKPVEYVKVCSIYGAGFFYIPGTDTCIKIGGWVRFEMDFNAGGSHAMFYNGGGGRNNRTDVTDVTLRDRFVISNDIRTQTEYGTLRAYTRAGFDWTTPEQNGGRFYIERAFIQFAGFTFGRSQSYFDFYANALYYTGYIGGPSSTGAPGTNLMAYTATFGNGFTATLAIEDAANRRNVVWDAGTDALTIGANAGPVGVGAGGIIVGAGINSVGDYAGVQVPDIVGSLRVDQAWGSAQIAGAVHQVRAGFYGNNATPGGVGPSQYTGFAPADKWGYAAMAGIVINLPWAKGDQFWVEGVYSVGAQAYTGISNASGQYNNFQRFNGGNVAAAWGMDAVFANVVGPTGVGLNGSGLELTTTWTIGAAVQHYWTPALRSSVFGAYTAVDFNANATNIFCASPVGPVRTFAGATPNFATGPVLGCNPDFNLWAIGTRTIWNPVPNLDIGVEIVYAKIETKHEVANAAAGRGVLLNFAGAGGRAAGLYAPSSEEVWSGVFRVQRNFWP